MKNSSQSLPLQVFQSGVVPSDTDYRIFRDYGRVPGLDIAYVRNGYVYHTEFDRPEYIEEGSIQRAGKKTCSLQFSTISSGENALALIRGLVNSPYLVNPAEYHNSAQWVFFDVWGLFTVTYSAEVGTLFNVLMLVLMLGTVLRNVLATRTTQWHSLTQSVAENVYTLPMYLTSIAAHVGALLVALITGWI